MCRIVGHGKRWDTRQVCLRGKDSIRTNTSLHGHALKRDEESHTYSHIRSLAYNKTNQKQREELQFLQYKVYSNSEDVKKRREQKKEEALLRYLS